MEIHNIDKLTLNHTSKNSVRSWYVIYTKPRHEKKVAEMLDSLGIEAYCPLKTQTKQWSDRKKTIETPLFNSYLFVNIAEANRAEVFAVSSVVRYIYWCGSPAKVRNQEIEEIKRWLKDFDHNDLEVDYYRVDQKIRILSGSFIHQEAKFVRQQGKHLILMLEGLGLILKVKQGEMILKKYK